MKQDQDPVRSRSVATEIVRTLRQAGHVAYFAGGCVRDVLLGLTPKDYDVATSAKPEAVRTIFPKAASVGAAFGVVLVKQRGVAVEVATFRSDGPYSDRRRPDHIDFSDAVGDAQRRDFTINALFLDPLATEPSSGVSTPSASSGPSGVIDHVGGVEDLRKRVVRAVGNPEARLAEDHLRALRAVRFAARLGFAIEPETKRSIQVHASELAGVSRERIGDEVKRMLAGPRPVEAMRLMQELRLDAPVLMEGSKESVLRASEAMPENSIFEARLGAWMVDRGLAPECGAMKRVVPNVGTALCLSNDEGKRLSSILGGWSVLATSWEGLNVAQKKRTAAGAEFRWSMAVMMAVDAARAAGIEAEIQDLRATPSGLAPEPLIDGNDLIVMGLKTGPVFRRVLEQVYDAQLEGQVSDRTGALELARRLGVQ